MFILTLSFMNIEPSKTIFNIIVFPSTLFLVFALFAKTGGFNYELDSEQIIVTKIKKGQIINTQKNTFRKYS